MFTLFSNPEIRGFMANKEMCSHYCRITKGCTHYYWEIFMGINTCSLRRETSITKENVRSLNNKNTACGIITQGNFGFY
jgi:hypothetical protein